MSVPEILGRYTANNIHLKSFLCPIFYHHGGDGAT